MPKAIKRRADNRITYLGPISASDQATLEAGTCLARVYNERKEQKTGGFVTRLNHEVAASVTSWEIPFFSNTFLKAGDILRVRLSTTEAHLATISSITPTADTHNIIIVDTAAPEILPVGSEINLVSQPGTTSTRWIVDVPLGHDSITAGDQLELELDDGTLEVITNDFVTTLTALEDGEVAENQGTYAMLVNLTSPTSVFSVGSRVRQKIGADISMASFGTPVALRTDWGFEGILADTLAGVETGQQIRIDRVFNGGAGLQDVISTLHPVVEG